MASRVEWRMLIAFFKLIQKKIDCFRPCVCDLYTSSVHPVRPRFTVGFNTYIKKYDSIFTLRLNKKFVTKINLREKSSKNVYIGQIILK